MWLVELGNSNSGDKKDERTKIDKDEENTAPRMDSGLFSVCNFQITFVIFEEICWFYRLWIEELKLFDQDINWNGPLNYFAVDMLDILLNTIKSC